MGKFITYNKEATFDFRKVYDPLSGKWKGEVLKDGEVVREYEEVQEFDLDFKMADDMQKMRAVEKMKHLD